MSTCNAVLDGLPNDILGAIAKDLRQNDLNRLCRVSKALHSVLNPLLWTTLTFRAEDEWKLDLNVDLLLRPYTYCPPQDHMQHLKNVVVTKQFHQNMHYPCPHRTEKQKRIIYGLEPGPDVPNLVERLSLSLIPFLQHLKDDQLRSFSWNLGTCLPYDVAPLFGPCGYIALKQSSIESLSLITESHCNWKKDWATTLGLHNLKKLQHLSWKGLRATVYMGDLRSLLECNADHMKSFEIDVVDWDRANSPPDWWDRMKGANPQWDNDVEDAVVEPTAANFLAWKVLRLQPKIHRVIFPALTELSLSNISFKGAAAELVCAFNDSMLRSLKLQNCRACATFLLALVDSTKKIRLRLFHLSMDDRDQEEEPQSVNLFLEAFEGLEELGLLIKPGRATSYYWISVVHHTSTLKRFVYHERLDLRIENEFLDNHPFTKMLETTNETSEIGFEELLVKSGLDCLAICDDLESLRKRLELLDSRSAIKLLHVRVSGADTYGAYDESVSEVSSMARRQKMSLDRDRAQRVPGLSAFASWAFGPDGLPNLRVLAYGDFSYHGRYIEDTFVFGRDEFVESCRKSTHSMTDSEVDCGYSLLTKEQRNEVMALYGDFLEACPVDVLVYMDPANMELT